MQRPFWFQAAWLTHEEFGDYLRSQWRQDIPLYPLLGHIARVIEEWNNTTFANVFQCKRKIWARLKSAQHKSAQGSKRF